MVARRGKETYPDATRLMITADGGGGNGARLRLWKLELQKLADETGLAIAVTHFPPGTSKWNKIEHRLFSFICKTLRGQPLTSFKVIVNLIAGTTTRKGPKVNRQKSYPSGIKVPDDEMSKINIHRTPTVSSIPLTIAQNILKWKCYFLTVPLVVLPE